MKLFSVKEVDQSHRYLSYHQTQQAAPEQKVPPTDEIKTRGKGRLPPGVKEVFLPIFGDAENDLAQAALPGPQTPPVLFVRFRWP